MSEQRVEKLTGDCTLLPGAEVTFQNVSKGSVQIHTPSQMTLNFPSDLMPDNKLHLLDRWTPSAPYRHADRITAPRRLSRWERFKMRLRHPFTRPPDTVQSEYVVTAVSNGSDA